VVPPKIHFVLWLLAHNKLAIVDNLNKKGLGKPVQCSFCNEAETINYLFFECVVAKTIWSMMSEVLECDIGMDYLASSGYIKINTMVSMFLRLLS
jgi:hypothetical protein